MTDERTDEQLMAHTGKGDLDAFGQLVDRHHQRALNLAFRLSGDREMSRDIAQESFLRILKGAHRYEPRARFTTFLYTVVRNLVIEIARGRQRRCEVPLDTPAGQTAGHPATGGAGHGGQAALAAAQPRSIDAPDVAAHREELGRRLHEALSALPGELRDAFVLTEIEGMSYREVAGICDCPEGTVASRKHHAVERLRRMLEPYDPKGKS